MPDRCDPPKISDDDAMARLREWEAAGGPVIEESVVAAAPPVPAKPEPSDLEMRHFHRSIDTGWRRTSYSGLIRVAETVGVTSEPEVTELDDETGDIPLTENASGPAVPSPMATLPRGATFGSLVHAVLENADPVRGGLCRRARDPCATGAELVVGGRDGRRAGRGVGADERHVVGSAGRRA